MKWLKRGICGIDLRKHTYIVAAFDLFFSVAGIVMGFIVIIYPENYVSQYPPAPAFGEVTATTMLANASTSPPPEMANTTVMTALMAGDESASEEPPAKDWPDHVDSPSDFGIKALNDEGLFVTTEQFHYIERVKALQNQVVEGLITAMVTVVVTLFLLHGVRSGKSVFFLPWLAENVTGLIVSFGVCSVQLLSGTSRSVVGSLIFMFAIVPFYAYWIYGVASLFVLIRRMKKHTREIISSVMQGSGAYQDGVNFEQLHEELSKEINLSSIAQPPPPQPNQPTLSVTGSSTATPAPLAVTRRDDVMYFSI